MQAWKYFKKAEFIYNGSFNDPELKYKGKLFNYYAMEDSIYTSFKEFCSEENKEPNDENFEIYCEENKDLIENLFLEYH